MWMSPPLAADVTISGSITFNLRAAEGAMTVNAAINCRIMQVDGKTGAITEFHKTVRTTELQTSETAENWSETPTSTVFKRGDRLLLAPFFDDSSGANMATGGTTFWWAGPTAAASGDTYVTFTETFSFASAPSGTTIYPTNTTSDVATAAVDREAWTSRGAGVQTDVTNTATGPVSPIQVTDTAGGTVVDWWTKALTGFTLAGPVLVNARALESVVGNDSALLCEIAVCNGDGSSPVVWAIGGNGGPTSVQNMLELHTAQEAARFWLLGQSVAVTTGQRLRIRFYVDDAPGSGLSQQILTAGGTVTLYYAGTSGGASGDTFLTFTETLTESSASPQTVELGLINASAAVYALDLSKQSVSLTLLDTSPTVYALTVIPQPVTVALDFLDSSPTVYDPVVAKVSDPKTLELALIDASSAVYNVTVFTRQIVTLDMLDSGPAVYDPTLVQFLRVTLSLVDAVSAVYAPEIANAATPTPLPSTEDARYLGFGMAVHVENDPNASVEPTGPADNEVAMYAGAAYPLISDDRSPQEWDLDTIIGPGPAEDGYYTGVSEAIHVWGLDDPPLNPRVIHGCKCCENPVEYDVISTTNSPTGWYRGLMFFTEDGLANVIYSANTYVPYFRSGRYFDTGIPGGGVWEWSGMYNEVNCPALTTRIRIQQWVSTAHWNSIGDTGEHGYLPLTVEVWRADWGATLETLETGILGASAELVGSFVAENLGNGVGDFPGATQSVTIEFDLFPGQTKAQFFFRPTAPVMGSGNGSSDLAVLTTRDYTQGTTVTFLKPGDYAEVTEALGDCEEGLLVECDSCEDPDNPGFQIPDFTPGYMPIFRRQIGDPQTTLDAFLCTMESGAMVLDWHTRGALQLWGGDLVQHCGRSISSILESGGTNLGDLQQAWAYYGQYLSIRSGETWADLLDCLAEGRAVVLQGDYDQFTLNERCQTSLVSNHAISVYPYQSDGRLLVGDPICHDFKGFKETSLIAYAEDLGVQVYGVTSPQKILFAVSRRWTP